MSSVIDPGVSDWIWEKEIKESTTSIDGNHDHGTMDLSFFEDNPDGLAGDGSKCFAGGIFGGEGQSGEGAMIIKKRPMAVTPTPPGSSCRCWRISIAFSRLPRVSVEAIVRSVYKNIVLVYGTLYPRSPTRINPNLSLRAAPAPPCS